MRIWSLHPRHLDRIGLVACWRETLLAQAVLAGRTKGYLQHPQLVRFRATPDPVAAVGCYLTALADEADARGYRFDRARIIQSGCAPAAWPVTQGQLRYEWEHLGAKLVVRSPDDAERWRQDVPTPHPVFHVVAGPLESWERPLG